jgi:hypothetical protein
MSFSSSPNNFDPEEIKDYRLKIKSKWNPVCREIINCAKNDKHWCAKPFADFQ